MTRVLAPSRLHFGLLHVPTAGLERWPAVSSEPGLPVRAYGGVGLMIDEPAVVVTAQRSDAWRVEGQLASRAQVAALRFVASLPEADRGAFRVLVERCPAEHAGFGVGTQLGLAVARAIAGEIGLGKLPIPDLARRVGRGERSAVGIYGFERGQLIVEAGKLPGQDLSPLIAWAELPAHWRVVLFAPTGESKWHGGGERSAFVQASQTAHPSGLTDALCRIALQGILPAAQADDLPAFGEAVYEYNRRAGEPFAAAQNGPYATPAVTALIELLRRSGVRGVGQSSWGPTVFAFAESAREAVEWVKRFRPEVRGWVARPSAGYRVEVDEA